MLVIPSVSIGNVPQLAVDLLIHTYGFELVKSLDDSQLSPFIGPLDHVADSKAEPGISTAAQLFKLGHDYLVQLRSPPLSGHKKSWVNSLSQQLNEYKENGVLLIGSANAGMDEELGRRQATRHITLLTDPGLLPESGFVNDALAEFEGAEALVAWVYEGDNFSDSIDLAKAIASELKLPDRPFKQPVSWSRVYGRDIPLGIEQGLYT